MIEAMRKGRQAAAALRYEKAMSSKGRRDVGCCGRQGYLSLKGTLRKHQLSVGNWRQAMRLPQRNMLWHNVMLPAPSTTAMRDNLDVPVR